MSLSLLKIRDLYYDFSVSGIILLLLALLFTAPLNAAENTTKTYEDEDFYLRFVFRTPEQTAAFYEGRGFPKVAINRIVQSCYVTVILKSRTDDIIWLELDNWEFKTNNKKIQRYQRAYWEKQWQEVNLKQAFRSTFGWTLLPEVRELQPAESVSGNITLTAQTEPFSLSMRFARGKNKKGKMKTLRLNDLYCKGR